MGVGMVQTVTGPVRADELGTILMHEHFFWGWPGWQGDTSFAESDEEIMKVLEPEVERIKAAGVKTVVDGTTNDAGRNPGLLRKMSEEWQINIICATGFFIREYGDQYWKRRRAFGCDVHRELMEVYERELYRGIAGSDIRAGYIKLAVGRDGMSRYEEMFFSAACEIAKRDETIRLFVHLSDDAGMAQATEYFREHGVSPRQIYLGHVCESGDLHTQIRLAEEGFYLGYDQFGLKTAGHRDNWSRIDQLIRLLDAGCEDQILISTDRTRHDLGRPNTYFYENTYSRLFLTDTWSYLFTDVLPALEKEGMTAAQKYKLTNQNAARFWSGEDRSGKKGE